MIWDEWQEVQIAYYHQAATQKYLQTGYFISETPTNPSSTYCLMHQLGPVGEALSHIWHLTNHHRAAIVLAGRP